MSVPRPPLPIAFFAEDHAREHCCDHVMTRPEAHDWALIMPQYCDWADPANDEVLKVQAASLWSENPNANATALLTAYRTLIRKALLTSVRLGWWWEERKGTFSEWFGMDLNGIFVIWDRGVIRSAHLRRNGSMPTKETVDRCRNPLPRRRTECRIGKLLAVNDENRHCLFRDNHESVSRLYQTAYYQKRIGWTGSDIFVGRAPRLGKWRSLVAEDIDAAGGGS